MSKEFWGYLTIILTLIGYAPYLHGIVKHKVRPHVFSWVVWTIVMGVAFAAQISKGAGPGAWFTGITGAICFIIAF